MSKLEQKKVKSTAVQLFLHGFCNSIERHLNNNGVTLKISQHQVFQNSNKILDAKLRINRRAGKENIQHKPVIAATDLVKIRTSPFLSMRTPAGLLRRTWFYVSLYWCRRGREGQRDLRRDSFKFTHDANGRQYAVMTHEEVTKNHHPLEQSSLRYTPTIPSGRLRLLCFPTRIF